mgnify:CR=1 FL=1
MKLELKRKWLTLQSTIGELYVDGALECFVLEDRYRPPPEPKVPRKTCIPIGRYEVECTHSPRFGRVLPLVKGVPGFVGIRIHPGNTAEDTEGCLLPGQTRAVDAVGRSVAAFQGLYAKLREAEARNEAVELVVSLEPS